MSSFLGLRYKVPVDVESERIQFAADSLSLRRHIVESDAQRWRFRLALQAARGQSAAAAVSHRFKNGAGAKFDIAMPQMPGLAIHPGVSATVNAAAAAGATSLTLRVGGAVGIIPEGRFLRFGTDTKVYMLTETIQTAVIYGNVTAKVFPALVVAQSSGGAVALAPNMRALYTPGTLARQTWRDGIVTNVVVDVEEALS